MGLLALYRLAVFQLIGIQHRVTKAIGVYRVIVNKDVPGFGPVLKAFHGGGKMPVRLLNAFEHVTGTTGRQHIYNLLAFPRVVTDTQDTHQGIEVQHVLHDNPVIYNVAGGEAQIALIGPGPV